MIKFLWERASFPAQTQSFLCGKFFTARLEVLPNLRQAGVFQMSTMVNFRIGLTRRWAFSLRLRWISATSRRCCVRVLLISFLSVFFFSRFCLFGLFLLICFVVFFYKYISTINSKKVMCFQRKDGILNMWINNLNFYYFLQFTVGKPALITIWLFSKQRSHELTVAFLWSSLPSVATDDRKQI